MSAKTVDEIEKMMLKAGCWRSYDDQSITLYRHGLYTGVIHMVLLLHETLPEDLLIQTVKDLLVLFPSSPGE